MKVRRVRNGELRPESDPVEIKPQSETVSLSESAHDVFHSEVLKSMHDAHQATKKDLDRARIDLDAERNEKLFIREELEYLRSELTIMRTEIKHLRKTAVVLEVVIAWYAFERYPTY